MGMRRVLCFIVAALAVSTAHAQMVVQSGKPLPGHAAKFYTNQVVGDAGTALPGAAGNGLSELGVTNSTSCGIGVSDAAGTSTTGGHTLCLGTSSTGAVLSYNPFGAGANLPLTFNVNGTTYNFPFTTNGAVGPATSGQNNLAAFGNTNGTLLLDTNIPFNSVGRTVSTNAALGQLASTAASAVMRLDYSSGLGATPEVFLSSNTSCSNPDGGSQVASSDGKCWIGQPFNGVFDALNFGAGTGVDDSTAIGNAFAACGRAGGGQIKFRPIGKSYVIKTGQTIAANGCIAHGDTHAFWKASNPIFDNNEADYTSNGVWFRCDDGSGTNIPAASCLTFSGDGSGLEGINFWHTQPTPPASSQCPSPCTFTHNWTPKSYPFDITVASTANHVRLRDLSFVNSSNCIDLEGPTNGIAGSGTSIEHVNFGCPITGIKFRQQDVPLVLNDLHHQMWWYQGSSDTLGWMEGNSHVDWDVCYLANPMITNVEFAFTGVPMKFSDCSVTSGFGLTTFAMSNAQAVNVSFNEVCQAMLVASSTTHVTGNFTNVILYTDTTTSPIGGQCVNQTGPLNQANSALDLASDNVLMWFNGLAVGFVQSLASIGGNNSGSVHGQLHINQLVVSNYSAYQNGTPLIATDTTGSFADVTTLDDVFTSASSPGNKCAGSCAQKVPYNDIAAHLPVCNATTNGAEINITDLQATPVYYATVNTGSGGGGFKSLAICDTQNWRLH